MAGAVVIFFIYLVSIGGSVASTPDFLMACSNTYGLVLVLLLLGYGLVEIPIMLWNYARLEERLHRLQRRAVHRHTDLFEAIVKLEDSNNDIAAFNKTASAMRSEIEPDLAIYLKQVVEDTHSFKLPIGTRYRRGSTERLNLKINDNEAYTEATKCPTINQLADLNAELKRAQRRVLLCQGMWEVVREDSISVEFSIREEIPYPQVPQQWSLTALIVFASRLVYWYWTFRWRFVAFKIASVLTAAMSFMLIWAEATMGLPWDMSPFGALLTWIGPTDSVSVFVAVLVPLTYLVVCQTRGLFELRLFGWYRLAGHQHSEAGPLLFNAAYLIRLQFSLSYNFLLMIRGPISDSGQNTAYGMLFKGMEVVPVLGTTFNVYSPIIMLIPAVFTAFRCYSRFLHKLGLSHEDADEWGGEEELEEGRILIKRAQDQADAARESESDHSSGEYVSLP